MSITINITKAREIVRDNLRQQRQPHFEALDVDFLRALEDGDSEVMLHVGAQKQLLRDVTEHPAIEAAADVGALKAITLEGLLQ